MQGCWSQGPVPPPHDLPQKAMSSVLRCFSACCGSCLKTFIGHQAFPACGCAYNAFRFHLCHAGLSMCLGWTQGHAPPLPCDPATAAPGSAVDLWAAHGNSGFVDPEHVRPWGRSRAATGTSGNGLQERRRGCRRVIVLQRASLRRQG